MKKENLNLEELQGTFERILLGHLKSHSKTLQFVLAKELTRSVELWLEEAQAQEKQEMKEQEERNESLKEEYLRSCETPYLPEDEP